MITFWTCALGLTLLLYVTLDGFDLGVGILFPLAPDETARRHMLAAISPVWDGNETWLVIAASILFGAFPLVYATLLSAFYLPLMVMLAALILRGVAFEFRYKSGSLRVLWDIGFAGGSIIAGFVQGTAFRLLPRLTVAVLAFLAVAFVSALALDLPVMHRWLDEPVLALFPLIGVVACAILFVAIRRRQSLMPFLCGLAIFAAAFATLAVSFYPYMVPFSITIADAVSPAESLSFMFWGAGIFVLPITLIYTFVVYFVFKGKVDPTAEYD